MENIAETFMQNGLIKRKPQEDFSEEIRGWMDESVLDPIRDHLAKDVWIDNGNKLMPKHKKYILDTLDKWLEKMEIDVKPSQIAIIGSIATYQYAKNSDIDVNVVIDIPDDKMEDLFPLLPNETPLPGTQHPVNYYLAQDAGENVKKKDAAYDVLEDKWIKKPQKSDAKVPYSYVLEIAKFFMAGIESRINEYERDKRELELYEDYLKDADTKIDTDELTSMIEVKKTELKADLDALLVALRMVKGFRKEAFEPDYEPNFLITIETKGPDFRMENLVYKMIERFGYIDKLMKYKKLHKEAEEKS